MVQYDFTRDAGDSLGREAGEGGAPEAAALKEHLAALGLDVDDVELTVDGDRVEVTGRAADQTVLALGNVVGVAAVEETVEAVAEPGGRVAESSFYTVAPGDTLWAIAEANYGNGHEEQRLLAANRPILADADGLYPGLVLRVPPLGSDEPKTD